MLMQAKNAVGFNTPGAASSAADFQAQDLPKSMQEREKVDVQKSHVFGIVSFNAQASFWKDFWMIF